MNGRTARWVERLQSPERDVIECTGEITNAIDALLDGIDELAKENERLRQTLTKLLHDLGKPIPVGTGGYGCRYIVSYANANIKSNPIEQAHILLEQ